jgi:hypothetical protein
MRSFIREALNERLHQVVPPLASDSIVRTMLVSNEINDFLHGPWDNPSDERRAGRLQSDLENFVTNGIIKVCLEPRMADTAFMARVAPIDWGIWDIRSRDPKPALRLLGAFSEPDVFIALVWAVRKEIKTDADWDDLIKECRSRWRSLFSELTPLVGSSEYDYVTENVAVE